MTFDKKIAAILLLPLLGLIIPAVLFLRKLPPPVLSAVEKELISFASQPVVVMQPGQPKVFLGLESPIQPPAAKTATANKAAASFPPGPIPVAGASAQQPSKPAAVEYLPSEVSMIYSDGQTHMAVIDGHVMREGASLGKSTVMKIEKTRVLLRTSGKDIWLNVN